MSGCETAWELSHYFCSSTLWRERERERKKSPILSFPLLKSWNFKELINMVEQRIKMSSGCLLWLCGYTIYEECVSMWHLPSFILSTLKSILREYHFHLASQLYWHSMLVIFFPPVRTLHFWSLLSSWFGCQDRADAQIKKKKKF